MALHRGRGFAAINYPIGMNLGGDPSQALVHSNPDGKFTVALSSIDLGQGMKSVTRQIAAETLGIPVGRLRRHRRQRHRPALHGQLRQPRHPPGRQRRDPGGAGGPRRDAGGRGRGAGGRCRRPRHRRAGQHPRQGRAVAVDHHHGRLPGGAVQAGPHGLRPRHLPDPAVRGRPRHRRDDARLLLRPRRPAGRGRGGRRDRRGQRHRHASPPTRSAAP
jgi:hypothetical protein